MMKDKSPHEINRIRTYQDLKREKERLKMEETRTEEKIKTHFNRLVDIFTFRNVFQAVSEDLSATSSIFFKTFEKGREFFKKHKKKKKKNIVPPEE